MIGRFPNCPTQTGIAWLAGHADAVGERAGMTSLALSFDIGGTFTDFVVIDLDRGGLVAHTRC
jgi:hypothetical protein